ncbi:MAG TPA: hypothetical protein VE222_07805, partial [Nitrospiraceae bacterium]|nr:hypothetical protein [Nitrospiraceae bacterium]
MTSLLLASQILLSGNAHLQALSVDDVLIDPFEVRDVCQPIDGEHPVSIQAAVQYKMAGDDEAERMVYGSPTRKTYQSFRCGKTEATVYYYEFGSSD